MAPTPAPPCSCHQRRFAALAKALPVAVLLGYSAAAAAAAAGGSGSGGGTAFTLDSGDVLTSSNVNRPTISNVNNDIITGSSMANPISTASQSATNNNNDIISNTARALGAAGMSSVASSLHGAAGAPGRMG